ncbi:MAG: DUF5717 family protein [Lachnospiraceae bacterium]|nr:DUF5717 family protein [Lachnospiraceae bacterium]
MKNKIQRFSKGDFGNTGRIVRFDETNVVLIVGEGESVKRSLTVKTGNGESIRGLIYASSFRIQFSESGFEGNFVRIDYSYDGKGLPPGHVESGAFTIVCSAGEYSIPFTAIIEKPFVMTSFGKVQNTDEFRKLAMKDYSEAVRFFRSREFYEILKYEDEKIFYLYDNMRKWSLEEESLEEFLVGTKLKEPIFLTCPTEGMLFEDVKEPTKGTLTLIKNTWGYMPIQIEKEGDFLRLSRQELSTDDFVGNAYQAEYVIRPEYLHRGRNFGVLRFVTPYETLTYEVEVLQNNNNTENHHVPELILGQVLKEYISFMAGRMTISQFAERTLKKVNSLLQLKPDDDFFQLLQAHIYVMAGQQEEAKWILENFNYNRFSMGKDPVINCYYLFLTAQIRNDKQHIDRVLNEIGRSYLRHQDSWIILYMLMLLDPFYDALPKRLAALEEYRQYGANQVLFYLEAALCYCQKPALLKKLGEFELQVLNFATKYRVCTKELALLTANFASQCKRFDPSIFRVMVALYNLYPETIVLSTIVTMLIKGDRTDKKYFSWYKKAIEENLKIAKLYECYMMSIDETRVSEALPRSIFLYFLHGNDLPYEKVAFLYANLATYMTDDQTLLLDYREQISSFTMAQLSKRRISEPLGILYKMFLREEDITGDYMDALCDICYSYRVTTKVQGMMSVLIIEKDGTIKQTVPYKENGAVVCLYDREARIIWEGANGRHYTDSIPHETMRLFYEPKFLRFCQQYAESAGKWQKSVVKEPLTIDLLKRKSFLLTEAKPNYIKEIYKLCSKEIRVREFVEDDFLKYLSFFLFKLEKYNKVTLQYLANYYLGPTRQMKKLWRVLKKSAIPSWKIAERIITQMVFAECTFAEEDIFRDYYESGNAYFRLKQAYLAYEAKEYFQENRKTPDFIFDIIAIECEKKEELADICKIALLKFFSDRKDYDDYTDTLHKVFVELCIKQIIFPFYRNYPRGWQRETKLFDKTLIEYRSAPDSQVTLSYRLRKKSMGKEGLFYSEVLKPVYGTVYVKGFILFEDEAVEYYIKDVREGEVITTPKQVLRFENYGSEEGLYGRLLAISDSDDKEKKQKMIDLQVEIETAQEIFKVK